MLRWRQFQRPRPGLGVVTGLLAMVMVAAVSRSAFALILGGEGNSPTTDPGWPKAKP